MLLTAVAAASIFTANAFEYYIASGNYRIKVSAREKHTIRDLIWKRSPICVGADYYGAVFSPARGINIGAGQKKAEYQEKLLECKVTCDGKTVVPAKNMQIKGKKIVIEKLSMFDKLLFRTRLELTPEGFTESCRFVATAAQKVNIFYAHVYCFNKNFTEFYALGEDDYDITGKFNQPGKTNTWHVESEVKSLTLYNEKTKKAVMLYYPEIIPGTSRNAAIWERSNTKKFYMMTKLDKMLPVNWESRTYTVLVRCFDAANPAALPAAVKSTSAAAAKYKAAELAKPVMPAK